MASRAAHHHPVMFQNLFGNSSLCHYMCDLENQRTKKEGVQKEIVTGLCNFVRPTQKIQFCMTKEAKKARYLTCLLAGNSVSTSIINLENIWYSQCIWKWALNNSRGALNFNGLQSFGSLAFDVQRRHEKMTAVHSVWKERGGCQRAPFPCVIH